MYTLIIECARKTRLCNGIQPERDHTNCVCSFGIMHVYDDVRIIGYESPHSRTHRHAEHARTQFIVMLPPCVHIRNECTERTCQRCAFVIVGILHVSECLSVRPIVRVRSTQHFHPTSHARRSRDSNRVSAHQIRIGHASCTDLYATACIERESLTFVRCRGVGGCASACFSVLVCQCAWRT